MSAAHGDAPRWPSVVVWAATGLWFAAYCTLAVLRYREYLAARFDLGNMVQAVRNTAHGHPLEVTLVTGEQTARLAAHADVFLAALAPFWIAFPSPELLIVVQAAALALGALPVFWLARKHIQSTPAALAMALAYLFYPWLAWAAVNDFHSVTVAVCFLLFAIWALDSDRLVLFSVFAIAALTTHELVGLEIAALGLWYAFARRRGLAGSLIAVAGLGWTVVCLKVVIPLFADGPSPFYGRFESVGGSPEGILHTAIHDPLRLLSAMTSGRDLAYVFAVLVPLALLPLVAPGMALVAAPQLVINLLADWLETTSPRYQYTAVLIPFLVTATTFAVARLSRGRVRVAAVVLLSSIVVFALTAPTWSLLEYGGDRSATLRRAAAVIPPGASVSSTDRLGGHLSDRRVFYSFPLIRDADWVIVDKRDVLVPDLPGLRRGLMPVGMKKAFARLERDPRFRLVFARDDVAVYKRV